MLVPGKMTDDVIRKIDQEPVDYLIWSNRKFPEYGVPVFGKDFDREFGDYLKSHYRPVSFLIPKNRNYWDWIAIVMERKRESEPQ
jgi:hypothetical protein